MDNYTKSELGVAFVREYLDKQKFTVYKRLIGENGFDLKAIKNGKVVKIEVKTTSNLKGGLPDMHNTEFYMKNNKWYFFADKLYIVRLNNKNKPIQLDILSKKEIDKYSDSHKTVIRIRTTKLDKDLYKQKIGQSKKL